MNDFCYHLNINIEPIDNNFLSELVSKKEKITIIPKEKITYEIINFLDSFNLGIAGGLSFYRSANNESAIHMDCNTIQDKVNMNWVYFQDFQSRMHWYKFKDTPKYKILTLPNGDNYTDILKEDVELIHSEKIEFPSIVQAGIPHSVSTGASERLCICLCLTNNLTNKKLTWDESANIFSKYTKI
jgi:hypothetical protein